jgi:hypothetical protein
MKITIKSEAVGCAHAGVQRMYIAETEDGVVFSGNSAVEALSKLLGDLAVEDGNMLGVELVDEDGSPGARRAIVRYTTTRLEAKND